MGLQFIRGQKAFTLVEALVTAFVAGIVMVSVQMLFSHAVRVTVKGQDNLDSIRAVSQIFSSLRNDLRDFVSLSPGRAKISLQSGESEVPENASYSKILKIKKNHGVVIYKLIESGGKKYLERRLEGAGNKTEELRKFGVPRMKDFGVLYVKTQNRFDSLPRDMGQLIIRIVTDSADQRFASKEINISSVFFSERLTDDDWNHLDLNGSEK